MLLSGTAKCEMATGSAATAVCMVLSNERWFFESCLLITIRDKINADN